MATNTKNFNFKKPDESDFYSIQDQNGNWDLADEELQKLNEPAFEDYTTGTSVPPAATALEALKSKIKLPVWMSNVVAFCKGCCTLAMIVNNCVSSDADKPLAAAQGKVLQDQLTKLYSDLRNVDVVNGSLLDYAKSVNTFENVNTGDPTTDIPESARYCIAHVMCRANSWSISIEGRDNRLYMNYNNGTDWTGWNSTALKSDLDSFAEKKLSLAISNFNSYVKSKTNRISFFAFSNAVDSPFSFQTGFCIAFNHEYLIRTDQFCLIGMSHDGTKIETKRIQIS